MSFQKTGFLSIEALQDQYLNQNRPAAAKETPEVKFGDVFKSKIKAEEIANLKFSKHATNRLADRNITLSDNQIERLSDGAAKASEKGIRDSLVIVDKLAFIVNVPNKTVVTAMDQTETNENVFTNIDGAVIA